MRREAGREERLSKEATKISEDEGPGRQPRSNVGGTDNNPHERTVPVSIYIDDACLRLQHGYVET